MFTSGKTGAVIAPETVGVLFGAVFVLKVVVMVEAFRQSINLASWNPRLEAVRDGSANRQPFTGHDGDAGFLVRNAESRADWHAARGKRRRNSRREPRR